MRQESNFNLSIIIPVFNEDQYLKKLFIDIENDPNETGLVGGPFSLITTDEGDLDAKLTTLDPNFYSLTTGIRDDDWRKTKLIIDELKPYFLTIDVVRCSKWIFQ